MQTELIGKMSTAAAAISYVSGLLWLFSIEAVPLKWFLIFAYHLITAIVLRIIYEESVKEERKRGDK